MTPPTDLSLPTRELIMAIRENHPALRRRAGQPGRMSAVPFSHNDHYHPLLLRQVPAGARTALDVGCGTGKFARRLAAAGLTVHAVDASSEVIELARALGTPGPGTIEYQQADIRSLSLPTDHYDFISCLASIHHVPFDTVRALRQALAPVLGGSAAEASTVLERAGVAPTARGEQLSIDDFVRIARA